MVPWELKVAEDLDLEKINPPFQIELDFIREFDPFLGIGTHEGRRLQAQVLPVFYEGKRENI